VTRLHRGLVLVALLSLLALTASNRTAGAQETPPSLIFPFPAGQTWVITCGYALPDPHPGRCGHSGESYNRYALDLQRVGGEPAALGQPAVAAAAGRVASAGWHSGLGWHVILNHGAGYQTVYAHFRQPPLVMLGAEVRQGQPLGAVGCTGLCTGAHIHFVLWKDGVSIPPEPICGLRGLVVGQELSNCAGPSGPVAGLVPFAARQTYDFTGDGLDDVTFFYEYGPEAARIHVFASDGARLAYTGPDGFWRADAFYPLDGVDQALAGDFTGDGRADLAALYDYPACQARAHVFPGADGRLDGPELWWQPPYYCASDVRQAAAGDFDGDTVGDIGLFYQLGHGETRLDVLRSNGKEFTFQEWWRADHGYWLGRVTHALPGDFNGDGRTDLATLYDYGDCRSRVHVFLSTGASFDYGGPEGWWRADGYCAASVKHAASGDFDGDGAFDDLAFVYEEGPDRTRIDVLRSDRSQFVSEGPAWWDDDTYYPAAGVRGLLPGDFNRDGRTDLAALFDYTGCYSRIHVFLSQGDRFLLPDAAGWWSSGGYCAEQALPAKP